MRISVDQHATLESYQRGGPCDSLVHLIGLEKNNLDISIVEDIANPILYMCFAEAEGNTYYTVEFVIYP